VIGSLHGELRHKAPPALLLEVGGVGYELEAPMSTFYVLPGVGERVRLLTHLVVREDAHILYGFATDGERALFRSLLKVNGIGPRIGLAILSGMNAEAFSLCVQSQDTAALTRIPGVGRKIAERLVVEMRDRLAASAVANAGGAADSLPAGPEAEAFSALIALGYRPPEALRLLKAAGPGGSTEDLIRRALQGAGRE
jgi:Holliday junction DNA helicase RuvA